MNPSTSLVSARASESILVAALYRFCRLDGYAALRAPLKAFCDAHAIRGTLLLAREGINGTVAGSEQTIAALLDHLRAIPGLGDLDVKFSSAAEMPFHRMKVRLKKEIVTMGIEDIDSSQSAGAYIEAADWNALVSLPDVVMIDTRNDYEVALGSFEGAVDPKTSSFRAFPGWAEKHRDELAGRKLAMFCTGGIRCEKATSYMKSLGFEEVYHLKGGILRYLEEVPAEESLWRGECFVFDERVSVTHGLEEGEAELCRACRHPVTPAEQASPLFRPGVSCPHCHDVRTEADRARYAERQRQVELSMSRGEPSPIGQRKAG
jgi:UPF0176 protein